MTTAAASPALARWEWDAFLPVHVVLMAGAALATFTVLWLRLYERPESHTVIALGSGVALVALMAYCRYALHVRWSSASMVYLALFWMFHFGLASTAVLVPAVLEPFRAWQVAWLFTPSAHEALLLAWLGALGFVGALGVVVLSQRGPVQGALLPAQTGEPVLYWIGWPVMILGLIEAALVLRASGGFSVLSLSYGDFRSTVLATTTFQTAINTSQLGCLFALCGATGRRWLFPLAVWVPFGGALLLLGLRTEMLLPLVSFAIVLAHRGVRFNRGLLIGAVVAALILIPAIKTFRQVGFNNRSEVNWTELSPLATLTELGGTLRATKAYVDWIDGGEEHLYGASYWAPIDRQLLVRIIPGREPIAALNDVRIPARNMGAREGSIGASATGEAFYNFGIVGPLIVFGGIGALFGWLERRASSSAYASALLGIAMAILYFNLRDQWLPAPGRAAVALAILGLCRVLGWAVRRDASALPAQRNLRCS